MNIYLQQFGLWFVMVPNTGLSWHSSAGGVHHMLIGDTIRGTHHAVVARNGYMIHDPHPSRMGLINGGSWNENLKAGLLVTKGQM